MACYICFCEKFRMEEMDFSKYDTILHVAAIVHQKEQPEMDKDSIMQLIQN